MNQPVSATGLSLYTEAAQRASAEVIDAYSTSFGWASKLLGKAEQQPVRNIYALVRVADEIVDGAADEAHDNPAKLLDELEAETYRALESGFSTNLVVHAFAHTARETGIKRDIIEPFFHSMRMDLTEREHDQKSFDTYVYGSAEVVAPDVSATVLSVEPPPAVVALPPPESVMSPPPLHAATRPSDATASMARVRDVRISPSPPPR